MAFQKWTSLFHLTLCQLSLLFCCYCWLGSKMCERNETKWIYRIYIQLFQCVMICIRSAYGNLHIGYISNRKQQKCIHLFLIFMLKIVGYLLLLVAVCTGQTHANTSNSFSAPEIQTMSHYKINASSTKNH